MSLCSPEIKEDGLWEGKLGQIVLVVVLQNLAVKGFRKDA
jgi:hypothetical protein